MFRKMNKSTRTFSNPTLERYITERIIQYNNLGSRQIKQNEIKLMRLNMIEIKFSSINCSVIAQRGQIIENKRDNILSTYLQLKLFRITEICV